MIAENEWLKLFTLGSDGAVEVSKPATDDERRDMEMHIRGRFSRSLIGQSKSTTYLDHRFRARRISIHFPVRKERLISHPLFWYFFAYLDLEAMAFADPVFVVPSAEVHEHASPKLRGDEWTFNFGASLEPEARDRWRKFRHSTKEVGGYLLHVMETLKATHEPLLKAGSDQRLPEGVIWIRHR